LSGNDAQRPPCAGCQHHFITYDPYFPYGCRAMNFKSRRPPYLDVCEASGMACQLFRRRAASADAWEKKPLSQVMKKTERP